MNNEFDVALSPDRVVLDLPFRGGRDYLHSTTILNKLLDIYKVEGPISLEFRKMIHHPIYVVQDAEDHENRVGTFSFFAGETQTKIGIYSDPNREINSRTECNEKRIIELYDSGADKSEGLIGEPGTMIETMVALNKAIVSRHVGLEKKVIFSALKVSSYRKYGTVAVELVKKLGTRLFQSKVYLDSRPIGDLTFMAI